MPPTELLCVHDTCNVWVLRTGRDAVCIDFGAGAVLDRLDELGIDRITDVLMTHHHRDGAQGLGRAVAAGARVWVPPVEQELFIDAAGFWQRRRSEGSYVVRQDGLTLLESVEIAGTVDEYRSRRYGGVELFALPTPGHTAGSVTYLGDVDGRRVAFTGDLLYGPGQVWSLAATQWSYTGVEGQAATLLSLSVLERHAPDVLLPAHGEPMEDPVGAITETKRRVAEVMELRRVERPPFDYERWLRAPWRRLSPHLLLNTTSIANSYALLSDSGAALLVDFGYDLWAGWQLGGARHENRPLLESIGALRRDHGIERIEALVTTHYHDDHVAGANLLREVEGTEVWAPENVAPILEHPERYDLPCLWFDPIAVDRVLSFGETVSWQEYELTVHPLPGHTRYAAAIELVVDGIRVLATGDQQSLEASGLLRANYQYRNRFSSGDYAASARLYARLRPELLLTGHWGAYELTDERLASLEQDGARIDELHRELLPVPRPEDVLARLVPYRVAVARNGSADLVVEVTNPFDDERRAVVSLALPPAWRVEPEQADVVLRAGETCALPFRIVVDDDAGRVPIAVELSLGTLRLGQHSEALVTVS